MLFLQSFSISIFIIVIIITTSVSGAKDVVFVVESSNNVNQEDFNYTIDFIYDVTKSLTVGPNDTQISLVTFNSDVTDHFVLNNCTNLVCVQNELDTVKCTVTVSREDSTKTEDALTHVKQTSLTAENGDRSGVDNLVFVILYGQSDTQINTILASMNLKNGATDLTVYVIGVGSMVNDQEMDAIATDASTLYKVSSGSELCNKVPDITRVIGNINVENTCVTTTTVTTTTVTTTTPTTTTTSTTSDTVTTTTSISTTSTEITELKDSSGDAVIIAAAVAACTLVVAISAILVFANAKVKEKCKINASHTDHQHMYIVQQYPDAALGATNCKFRA